MHRPLAFVVDDPERLLALVRAHPLATMAVNGAAGPALAYAPLAPETDAEGRIVALVGHMARANPFWRAAEADGACVAVFAGPDAYVTPAWYSSKAEHGRVVPTWNYVRAEFRGRLELETDPERMRPYLDRPTDAMEAARPQPWAVDDAPAAYVARLSAAVVGVRLNVESAEGAWKLSQNKIGTADYKGVREGLAASLYLKDRAIAALMET